MSHLAAWARDLENDEARELEENQGIDQHTFVRILENYPKKDERYVQKLRIYCFITIVEGT